VRNENSICLSGDNRAAFIAWVLWPSDDLLGIPNNLSSRSSLFWISGRSFLLCCHLRDCLVHLFQDGSSMGGEHDHFPALARWGPMFRHVVFELAYRYQDDSGVGSDGGPSRASRNLGICLSRCRIF
jgi:hypothetical protein